jgi:hypothetical protein
MSLLRTISIAQVSADPNTIAGMQENHALTAAVSEDGTQRWNYYPENEVGSKWVLEDEENINVTLTELLQLITDSELEKGLTYEISGVQPFLYGGTTIWLKAISSNQLEVKGTGKFYVPKYYKEVEGYGIWLGKLFDAGLVDEPTYEIDDKVIWGGKVWKNLTGDLGTSVDIFLLDDVNWEVIPFNEVDYNIEYDEIGYDIDNDCINYRRDKSNNEMSFSYNWWEKFEKDYFDGDMENSKINPIKSFQWGNHFDYDLGVGNMTNKCTNSFIENINEFGNFYSNTLNNNSSIYSNTLGNNSYIYYNTLENISSIYSNTLDSNSGIYYNTLGNISSIYSNTLENNSSIYSNTLGNNSYIYSNTLGNNNSIYSNTLDSNSYIYSNTLGNNNSIYSNTLENNSSIYSNTLGNNSYIYYNTLENISSIYSNTLDSNSGIYYNTLGNISSIYSNTLDNSGINYNTLGNNSYIYYNTLENISSIYSNTLDNGKIRLGLTNTIDNKQIQLLTINGGDIGGDSGIDLSTAILVYGTYERFVFKDSAGVTKIRYINGSGVQVIADLDD